MAPLEGRPLRGFHGMPAAAIIEQVGPHLATVDALARIEELEVTDGTGIVALPGVLEAIAALSAAEPPAPFAIATSATGGSRRCASPRPASVPEGFVTVDDVERGKPHPDPFLLDAARAAGCSVRAVTTTAPAAELAGADLVVGSLAEVTFAVLTGGSGSACADPSGHCPACRGAVASAAPGPMSRST